MTSRLRGSQLITCATKCKEDKECWEKCSVFWKGLRKDCTEMVEIMGCHKQCHHDNACHRDCPRPKMLWLKEKVEASMACHHECGANRDCHHKCQCPFAEMKEKCETLGAEVGSRKVKNVDSKPMAVTV
ncbi:unnamed protein product [Symbiodinium pilosum]|uniref:Uncharacterized protein n=1 Tax=Symbiodinium pilosum TaxID=2952 RepID=A0A812JMJ0_SYMPI|nr:unnamed protein product [Symbiodinium pilosum]